MKRLILILFTFSLITVSCEKDSGGELNPPKQLSRSSEGGSGGDDYTYTEEFECEYILEPAPQPLKILLENPNNPREETLDMYMYFLAKALSRYTCISGNFEQDYDEQSFARYGEKGDPNTPLEAEYFDMIDNYPALEQLVVAEFQNAGLDWNVVKTDFNFMGHSYVPTIYFENRAVADWAKDPYIGVGSDVDVAQSAFGDFIPVFLNQCTPEAFDPDEYIIGKPDVAGIDTVVNYDAICLDHPLLIVEYGWNKGKKSSPIATNNDPIDGDFVDTLTTPPPPSEPDPNYQCDPAEHYTIIQGGLACERFEKGKRSEYYCKYTLTDGTPDGFAAGKKIEKLKVKKIHKNDKCKTVNLWAEFRLPVIGGSLPISGYNLYGAVYEYDWHKFRTKRSFPTEPNGFTPKIKLRHKWDHEIYQIFRVAPADWCAPRVKEYKHPRGRLKIMGYQ